MKTTTNLLPISSKDTSGMIREIRDALDRGIRPAALLTVNGINKVTYGIYPPFMEVAATFPKGVEVRLEGGTVGRIAALRFPLPIDQDDSAYD